MAEDNEPNGAYGNSPKQWREKLSRGLDSGVYDALKSILLEFGKEIKSESRIVSRIDNSPFVDRLIEQARQIASSTPTETEVLKNELTVERKLWASFRKKYRETYVPENLHPYLDDMAVFVTPSEVEPQFEGFDKYTGYGSGNRSEAITLFHPHKRSRNDRGYEMIPNFYTSFTKSEGRFIIHRAYRGELPRGSGEKCLFEHLATLMKSPSEFSKLTVENVQNAETYKVFVNFFTEEKELVKEPKIQEAPLVRLGERLIERAGMTMGRATARLDIFGFLDLDIKTK